MKKLFTLQIVSLAVAAIIPLSAGLTLICGGCGTNAPTKAAQAEQVVIASVNAGVKSIVVAINAGKLTAKQKADFKTAYIAYYDAQQIARAAIEKFNAADPNATAQDMSDAQNAVTGAENALLSVINTILQTVK